MWNADETEIGTVGSESGTIILDLEYSDGARITLEKETSIAPFAITVGVYGLLMHTIYCSDESEATQKITVLKGLIEKVRSYSNLEKREDLYNTNTIDEIVDL